MQYNYYLSQRHHISSNCTPACLIAELNKKRVVGSYNYVQNHHQINDQKIEAAAGMSDAVNSIHSRSACLVVTGSFALAVLLILSYLAIQHPISAHNFIASPHIHTAPAYDHDFAFTDLAAHYSSSKNGKFFAERPCPVGCEKQGNCNKALGRCECPIGYRGPTCNEPVWPACKLHPTSREMFCDTSYPKSCDCFRQCANFTCPNGTASCERFYDITKASVKCFERPAGFKVVTNGVTWDGGSDIPADGDEEVRYYQGATHDKNADYTYASWAIERYFFLDMDPSNENGLMALPLSNCPDRCSNQGGCVQRKKQPRPFCKCHYGFAGYNCAQESVVGGLQNVCWNNCQGRGVCRRGFCHCKKGYWGKDCGRSKAYAAYSGRRLVHRLKVYAYDLPWEYAYQPEYTLGWRDHDQIYMAWKVFGERLLNDTAVRTDNPWEANMFYIPSLSFAYSSNLGTAISHNRRVISYIKQTWPFFNRTQGLDHFLWLPNDRGACFWPGDKEPDLANVIKVVHFGWHNHPGVPLPEGWPLRLQPNKHWGCYHPLRDVVAAPYWQGQADAAAATYGTAGEAPLFDPKFIPKKLLFFAGSVRRKEPEYSFGVRQELHALFGAGSHPNITILEGSMPGPEYLDAVRSSKFCMAPSGHGWGIRLAQYIVLGCVPVIIQDDIYQPWEGLLPYSEFSIRLPKSRIPDIADLLSAVTDKEYRTFRTGLAKHWGAFVWEPRIGGRAYEYMIKSLHERMVALNARHFHPLLPERWQNGSVCQQQQQQQLIATENARSAGKFLL